MAFCPTCGSQVEGRFCAKCGSAVPAGGPSAPPPPPPPPSGGYAPQGGYAPPPAASGGMTDNVASALCYVLGLITGIIFLVLAPYNQNRVVRFHAFQSIFMHVGLIVMYICLAILGVILAAMHLGLLVFLFPIVGLAVLVLWICMIVFAYQGKQTVLPIIGPLALKQAGN